MQDGIFPMKYVGEPPVDSDLYKWNELALEASRRSGRPWDNTLYYAEWMREIGFEDVVEKNFYWPTSPWPKGDYFKQVAIYFQEDMLNGLEGISMKVLTKFMGWTAEEVQALLVGVKRDFRDLSIHAYLRMWVILTQLQTSWLISCVERWFMAGSPWQLLDESLAALRMLRDSCTYRNPRAFSVGRQIQFTQIYLGTHLGSLCNSGTYLRNQLRVSGYPDKSTNYLQN
jgi:hypothetical protein